MKMERSSISAACQEKEKETVIQRLSTVKDRPPCNYWCEIIKKTSLDDYLLQIKKSETMLLFLIKNIIFFFITLF